MTEQSPKYDEERSERNPKNHSENTPKCSSPEKYGGNDHNGMQTGTIPHHPWAKPVTFEELN